MPNKDKKKKRFKNKRKNIKNNIVSYINIYKILIIDFIILFDYYYHY